MVKGDLDMKHEYYSMIIRLTRERNDLFREVNKELKELQTRLKNTISQIPKDDVFTEEQDDELYKEMEIMQDLLEEFYNAL